MNNLHVVCFPTNLIVIENINWFQSPFYISDVNKRQHQKILIQVRFSCCRELVTVLKNYNSDWCQISVLCFKFCWWDDHLKKQKKKYFVCIHGGKIILRHIIWKKAKAWKGLKGKMCLCLFGCADNSVRWSHRVNQTIQAKLRGRRAGIQHMSVPPGVKFRVVTLIRLIQQDTHNSNRIKFFNSLTMNVCVTSPLVTSLLLTMNL